jgi:ABC-type multidrug transport system ATPase subunit
MIKAATTYDIVKQMSLIGRLNGSIKIVSLLQPPPETVALFDEIILVDSGRVIYSGPVDEVVSHFNSLGYKLPDRIDAADWLQVSNWSRQRSRVSSLKIYLDLILLIPRLCRLAMEKHFWKTPKRFPSRLKNSARSSTQRTELSL